jgi:hypothetical protein
MNAKNQLATMPSAAPRGKPWGTTVIINAAGCDDRLLNDPEIAAGFLAALPAAIGMKAFGDPEVPEFGEGALHGLSGKQWIYQSCVVWHAGGAGFPGEAYLDITTCGDIDPPEAARFHEAWFGGTATVLEVIERGVRP